MNETFAVFPAPRPQTQHEGPTHADAMNEAPSQAGQQQRGRQGLRSRHGRLQALAAQREEPGSGIHGTH